MNPLTQFKKIRILPPLIALALVFTRAVSAVPLPPGNTVHSGTRSPRTRSWAPARSRRRASSTWRTCPPRSTTPSSRSRAGIEPPGLDDHSASRGLSRLRGHRGQPTARSAITSRRSRISLANLDADMAEALSPANLTGAQPTAVRAWLSARRPPTR